MNTECAGKTMR